MNVNLSDWLWQTGIIQFGYFVNGDDVAPRVRRERGNIKGLSLASLPLSLVGVVCPMAQISGSMRAHNTQHSLHT